MCETHFCPLALDCYSIPPDTWLEVKWQATPRNHPQRQVFFLGVVGTADFLFSISGRS